MITIRRATLTDIDLLLSWREEVVKTVFHIPTTQDITGLIAENRSYYQTALADGSHIACFAESGGAIVGCGGICFSREMPSPDNTTGICAYIMNIYVPEECRKTGIGTQIVKWLISRAKERNAGKIYLETTKHGEGLYRSLGFIGMRDMMRLND